MTLIGIFLALAATTPPPDMTPFPFHVGSEISESMLARSDWKITQHIKGDLNKDGKTDRVFVLERTKDHERRLVVALNDANKDVVKEIIDNWTGCFCGRDNTDTLDPIEISPKGVVILRQDIGSSYHEYSTWRFRWSDDGLELIGFDHKAIAGWEDPKPFKASINLLTGDFECTEAGKSKTERGKNLDFPKMPRRMRDTNPDAVAEALGAILSKSLGRQINLTMGRG